MNWENKMINIKTPREIELMRVAGEIVGDTHKYLIPYLKLIKENKKIYTLIHDKPLVFNKQQTFKKMYNEVFSCILDKYGVIGVIQGARNPSNM